MVGNWTEHPAPEVFRQLRPPLIDDFGLQVTPNNIAFVT
jgi:hypothetical protein